MKTIIPGLVAFLLGCSGMVQAQAPIITGSHSQRGPLIAVNPTNSSNLIGVAIVTDSAKIGAYYSSDSGANWYGADSVSGSGSATDPVLAFDPDGIAYLVYMGTEPDPGLYLRKSTDGGVSWSEQTSVRSAGCPSAIFHPTQNTLAIPQLSGVLKHRERNTRGLSS